MPRTHTDSQIVEHHEDGSWTTTTVVTETPATTAQKAVAATALVGIFAAPFIPVLYLVASEKIEARLEARKAKKNAKKND